MRILHTVEFYHPSVGGAQEVVKRVSEALARRGHEVTVATTRLPDRTSRQINGVQIVEFDISGSAGVGIRGDLRPYLMLLKHGSFDLMMNYAAQQWATDLAMVVLPELPYKKMLVPFGFSQLHNDLFRWYFERMPDVLRQYDHLIVHSNGYTDGEFCRQHGLAHTTLVPNGASEEEFSRVDPTFRRRYGIPADVPMLLTVGSHTGLKGHAKSMRAFLESSIGRAVLVIVGNTPVAPGCLPRCRRLSRAVRFLSLGRKRVLLLDPPREDVVAAFHAADLFVFCSQVEGSPIVLFEAMASRTPFVTLDVGNAREIVEWSGGGVVVPSQHLPDGRTVAPAGDVARQITELMRDRDGRQRLAEAGHRAWQERFTWEKIVGMYEEVYRRVCQ